MKRRRGAVVALAALAVAPGCGGIGTGGAPIPVEAAAPDRARLTGRWEGRYWSDGDAGYGRIGFELQAGTDTARGEVVMEFSPALRLYHVTPAPCTTLDIAMIRVAHDSVRGSLAPYWNPDCDCRTRTVFRGALREGRIAGVFTTLVGSGDSVLATGRWVAERR